MDFRRETNHRRVIRIKAEVETETRPARADSEGEQVECPRNESWLPIQVVPNTSEPIGHGEQRCLTKTDIAVRIRRRAEPTAPAEEVINNAKVVEVLKQVPIGKRQLMPKLLLNYIKLFGAASPKRIVRIIKILRRD